MGDAETTDGPGVRSAVLGIVAYSVAAPSVSFARYLQLPHDQVNAGVVALTVGAVPILAWLTHTATRGPYARGPLALLAGATVAMVAAAVIVGPLGWAQLYVPVALIAVTLPSAWSVVFLLGLAAAAAPLAAAAGRPDYALFYTFGVLVGVLPLAVSLRLVRSVRQLQAARQELAAQATARERLRIDEELTTAVVGALTDICERAERAAAHVGADPVTDEAELRALGVAARRALGDVRRVVRGYRDVSLPAELAAAATLLTAAGIEARIEPPEGPATSADPADRRALRQKIAALLAAGSATGVILAIRDGRPVVRNQGPRPEDPGR